MIWKSIWHIESTSILATIVLAVVTAAFASLGVHFDSPRVGCLAGFGLLVLIYRLRYKRF
jgi:hypothetical protein